MMYCTKCGSRMEEGARFCTVCGAMREETASRTRKAGTKKRRAGIDPRLLMIGGGALTLLLTVLLAVLLFGGKGPEKQALNFFRKMTEMNEKALGNYIEPSLMAYLKEEDRHIASESDRELVKQNLKSVRLSYKITKEKELDEDDLAYLAKQIKKHYDDLLDRKINADAFRSYTVRMTMTHGDDTQTQKMDILMMKVEGHWYVAQVNDRWIESVFRSY